MLKRLIVGTGALTPVLVVLLAAVATSSPRAATGREPVPVLVELFTSEGCSSCPPADALLIELVRTQPIEGVQVVALGEHVDYWDRLGWVDPFSSAAFTRRQEAYAHAARTNRVYTPQVVVDGHLALVGSDRAAVFAAVRRAASSPKAAFRLDWMPPSVAGATRELTVSLPEASVAADVTVYIGVVEDGLVTTVTRGENQGRNLAHAAVTRELRQIGKTNGLGGFDDVVPVRLETGRDGRATRVVVFAQRDAGRVLAIGLLDVPSPGFSR